MQIILFFGGIILLLIGVGMFFGFSVAMFLADLFSILSGGSHTGGFVNSDLDTYRGSKNIKTRWIGFFLMIVGFLSFIFSLSL